MSEPLKFDLHQKVNILPLHKDLIGTILSIWITSMGTRYEVRYFWENKPNDVYFYEWELKPVGTS